MFSNRSWAIEEVKEHNDTGEQEEPGEDVLTVEVGVEGEIVHFDTEYLLHNKHKQYNYKTKYYGLHAVVLPGRCRCIWHSPRMLPNRTVLQVWYTEVSLRY